MTAKTILQLFDNYQKARILFVEQVADLSSHANNITTLESAGVLCLLQPLLNDICPSVQQYAATAIGRLANGSQKTAKNIVQLDILPAMLRGIDKKNKFYRKAVMFSLRAIAKHNEDLATVIVHIGGLEVVLRCIEDFDSNVKLAAVFTVNAIVKHSRKLAQTTVDAGVVPLLILCLQEPELCLKQASASAITDIAKHSPELAKVISDCAGSLLLLSKSLQNSDAKLKRHALMALDAIATHNVDLAEACVEAEIYPSVLLHIQHPCNEVSKAACALTRDTVKHALELSQLIVNQGGIAALLEANNEARIAAYAALGYIGGHSEQLALAITNSNAMQLFSKALDESQDECIQATTAWTLGQIGKHTPEHARYLAEANIFLKLLKLYQTEHSEDLKNKCKMALKQTLPKCMVLSVLEPLLYDSPPEILKYVLGQFAKILPNDPRARRLFVTTGGLKKVQEIVAEPGSTLLEYIICINRCFPEEIVKFYSPGYPETLLDKIEQYMPQVCLTEMGHYMESDDDLPKLEDSSHTSSGI